MSPVIIITIIWLKSKVRDTDGKYLECYQNEKHVQLLKSNANLQFALKLY